MRFTIESERKEGGRWLAEVLELSGALTYGQTPEEAIAKAQALALRVLADRLEHGEGTPRIDGHFIRCCMSQWKSASYCAPNTVVVDMTCHSHEH